LLVELLEDRSLPSFLPPVGYPVGNNPHAVVAADFTGAGFTDLVLANYASGTVSVLLGKGDGTFQPAQNYAVGPGPTSVAVGDFNNDGKLDIVTANGSGTVSVLLGKGDGTFQPAINYSLPTETGLTQSPVSLAVGDFDKDGKLDVAVTAYTISGGYYASATAYVNVLVGNGAGGFAADNVYALGSNTPGSVAVADFNGDNNPDLAVAEGSALSVLLGNGDGTFQAPQTYTLGGTAGALAVGDFNRDGKTDLVTANSNGTVSVLLGNGAGGFTAAANYGVGAAPDSVAVADLNHDGKLDIVTSAATAPSLSVLLGKGDGTFYLSQNFDSGSAADGLAVGDFNRDGWPDVAVANASSPGVASTTSVLLNTGDWSTLVARGFPASITAGATGSFTVTAQNPNGTTDTNYTGMVHFTSSDPQAVLPADYTFTAADAGVHTFNTTLKTAGAQTITVMSSGTAAYGGPEVTTTVNPAAASRLSFEGETPGTPPPSDASTGVALSMRLLALDPYGNIATGYAGTVQFSSTDPKAVLPAPFTFTTGNITQNNGDVLFQNGFTLNTKGNQTITATDKAKSSITGSTPIKVVDLFLAPVSYPLPSGSDPVAVAVGDFRGGGSSNVVVADNGIDQVSVLLDKPDGTLEPAQNYAVEGAPVAVAVADFNGDGKLDIVTANDTPNGGGTVSVLLGNGDGTFQPAANYVLPLMNSTGLQKASSLAVGDFNKDGKLDVAVGVYNQYAGGPAYVNVLIGNGTGSFTADKVTVLSAGGTTYSTTKIAAGDFNGDGSPDLAAAGEPYLGSLSVLRGNGDGSFKSPALLSADWSSVAVGDFNGDGKLDLLTWNQLPYGVDSLHAGVWLGNGDGTFAPPIISNIENAYKSAAAGDFDQDGKLDIALAGDGNYGVISIVLGNGNGSFGSHLFYPSGPGYARALAVGDFNHDGSPDLVVANTGTNTVSVLLNLGNGSALQASRLGVSGFPSSATAGTAGTFTVTAKNADGSTATNYTGTVHFTSSDPRAALPADYSFTTADQGVHTFSATLKTAGTQSIRVTDKITGSITGAQSGIVVHPAAASKLSVTGFPSPITAGVAGALTVTLRDPYGNIATGYIGSVHFTSSDRRASLPANYTFNAADAGVHTFSATLKTAGTQSLTATDTRTGSLTATEAGITVNPAAASQFVISAPSSVTAGTKFSLTLTVEDADGNVVTNYTGTIHFTSTDSTATLPKNYSFTVADKGVHSFTGLVLRKKGNQKITITDTLHSSITGSVIENVL
jgi:hypothetical protein